MGVAGLFVASHAGDGVGYWGGLAIFLFAFAAVFLIRTTLDHEEERPSLWSYLPALPALLAKTLLRHLPPIV